MKTIQTKPASPVEITFIVLTLSLLWGGFISFGQVISEQGFFTVSWKWLSGSVLIAAFIFVISLFFLSAILTPGSKTWKLYEKVKGWLIKKPVFLLAFSFLVLILSVFLYLIPHIHGSFGINLFSLMLLWLFLLPLILFLVSFQKKGNPSPEKKTDNKIKNKKGFLDHLNRLFVPLGKWNALWMGALFALFLVSFFSPWSLNSLPAWLTLLVFLALALIFTLGFRAMMPERTWGFSFVASILFVSAGARIASYFTIVSNDPFSIGWSEGMRIFYASLVFSKSIYGIHLGLPYLSPNLAILQSVPFLLDKTAPIWIHRLWRGVLWLVIPLSFGFLVTKKMDLSGFSRIVFIAWIFLFLQQGPVFYFLLLGPVIILLTRKVPRFWIAMLLVAAASIWIGIDRMNWYPLPGCLMAMMYLFETPYSGKFWSYWWKPLAWIFGGLLLAISARVSLMLISGYPASYYVAPLASNLLTYRLLPNATNSLGIIPMISLAVLPIGAVILAYINVYQKQMHWSRRWVFLAIMLVFFLGDVLVSLKIGGGNNLHNFDALMVLIIISASMYFFGKVATDTPKKTEPLRIPAWLLGSIALIPVIFSFSPASVLLFSKSEAQSALSEINQQIAALPQGSKPVLFISQTQLLATGLVKNVTPIPPYELQWMMDMAMSKNSEYLDKLYSDLSNQRFSLIIAPTLSLFQKGSDWSFGEENDVWNNAISGHILSYYHPILIQKDFGFEILAPNVPTGK